MKLETCEILAIYKLLFLCKTELLTICFMCILFTLPFLKDTTKTCYYRSYKVFIELTGSRILPINFNMSLMSHSSIYRDLTITV